MDDRVLTEMIGPAFLARHPVRRVSTRETLAAASRVAVGDAAVEGHQADLHAVLAVAAGLGLEVVDVPLEVGGERLVDPPGDRKVLALLRAQVFRKRSIPPTPSEAPSSAYWYSGSSSSLMWSITTAVIPSKASRCTPASSVKGRKGWLTR
jgi:hypothetical protein